MRKTKLLFELAFVSLMATSCASHYQLTNVQRTRILVDHRYDGIRNEKVDAMMRPYKHEVDSLMSPVVGRVKHDMSVGRPESTLSNLLSDILVWGGRAFHETPDFAVYNMGGIRAALVKGNVTKGDVVDVAPFENKLCFLTLTGEQVLELFKQIASVGGEGVSHGVELRITKDGQLKSALVHGKPIDPQRLYRIATLDYLAQGNDKLVAFKKKTQVLSPQDKQNNVRFIIMDYFQKANAQGLEVDAAIEGRIVVE